MTGVGRYVDLYITAICASIDYVHVNVSGPVNKPQTSFYMHIITDPSRTTAARLEHGSGGSWSWDPEVARALESSLRDRPRHSDG